MSGYGSGRESGPSGREVDPAWLAWAEEQTIKLLRAQERFTYLPPGRTDEAVPEEVTADFPPPPAGPGTLDEDPIRVVQELHLEDPPREGGSTDDETGRRMVDLADGRRFVVRVHRDNLRR